MKKLLIFLVILSVVSFSACDDVTDEKDNTAPSVNISSQAGSITANYPIPITMTFSEDVTDFEGSDLSIVHATLGEFVAVSGSLYTANLYPDNAPADISVSIGAGVADDLNGNANTASENFDITYNGEALTLVITTSIISPTSSSNIPVTITFSEAVCDFTVVDILIANGTPGILETSDNIIFTLKVTPTENGVVSIDIPEAVAEDALLGFKANTASERLEVIYDTEPPTSKDFQPIGVSNGYALGNPAFIGVTGEDIAAYRYKLNGAATWTELDIAETFSISGSGYSTIHTVEIIARDNAGNWQDESDPQEFSFVILDEAPDGSQVKPFLVYDCQSLQDVNSSVSSCYLLISNIDASITSTWDDGDGGDAEGFVPIGNYLTEFTGTFDGNNFKIVNLHINRFVGSYRGLFGYIEAGGIVKNLEVKTACVKGRFNSAILVGLNNGMISSCTTSGTVEGEDKLGGIAGVNNGSIMHSFSAAMVNGEDNSGGLVGWNEGEITNCHASGTVTGTNYSIGGLVGYNFLNASIVSCYSINTVYGANCTGGLVGTNSGNVSGCYALGEVSGIYRIGNLIGINGEPAIVEFCYATGATSGDYHVGCLIGDNAGVVQNCYGTGSVSGIHTIGGLIGYCMDTSAVTKCYSTGLVADVTDAGGFAGIDNGSIIDCYYDSVTSGRSDNTGKGVPKTTTEMKQQPTFTGWDFLNIWTINSDYPFLTDNTQE